MFKKKLFLIALIAVCYLILTGILVYWTFSYRDLELRNQLVKIMPVSLDVNFILILFGLIVCGGTFKQLFKEVPQKFLVLLTITAFAGIFLFHFVAPITHRIFYDEDIYQVIALNIAEERKAGMCNEGEWRYGKMLCNRTEYDKHPYGYSHVLSLLYRVFGANEQLSFLLNNIIATLSTVVVFFICYLLFKDIGAAFLSGLIYTLIPENILWSNTVAVEPSAAFFSAFSILNLLLFTKCKTTETLFLTFVVTTYAIQFRPESILILVIITLHLFLNCSYEFKDLRIYILGILLFLLLIPHFVHLYAVKNMGWGQAGGKFSLEFFKVNLFVNGSFYLLNRKFPVIYTLLFFMGLLKKGCLRGKLLIFSWFLLFWGIFLFFYAGSYEYGVDVRFSLVSYLPIAVLAGLGASYLGDFLGLKLRILNPLSLIAISLIFLFLKFMPYVRAVEEEAWAARHDHEYAKRMSEILPKNSIIMTHNPNMFLIWGKNAAQVSLIANNRNYFDLLYNRFPGGVYFHYNFWCNVDDPIQKSLCENILKIYKTTRIMAFKERDYNYMLYKLE